MIFMSFLQNAHLPICSQSQWASVQILGFSDSLSSVLKREDQDFLVTELVKFHRQLSQP